MKYFISALFLLASTLAFADSSMKIEGTCSGAFKDGLPVAFTYFSDFDGKKDVSEAAISFTEGREGLYTGKRSFTDDKDIYQFNKNLSLTLANSTGNTKANLRYLADDGKTTETIEVQCEIRDYEYPEY